MPGDCACSHHPCAGQPCPARPPPSRAAGSSSFYPEVAAPGRAMREQGKSPGELGWSPRISHTLHPDSAQPSLGLNHFWVQTPKLCTRVCVQLPRGRTAQIRRPAPSPALSAPCHRWGPSMPPSAPILLKLHQLCHPQESRATPGYPSGTSSWHLGREVGVPGRRGDFVFLPQCQVTVTPRVLPASVPDGDSSPGALRVRSGED